jgi:RNA polymerase sigma-70 factor (ECF subfamily)
MISCNASRSSTTASRSEVGPFQRFGSTENAEPNSERSADAMPDAAFRALYEAHFRVVWSALSRLRVREEDLMDLTQKVFLIAYLKLPSFEGRSQLSTWLWGISRRVAVAYQRSAAMRREVVTDPLVFEHIPVDYDGKGELSQEVQAILRRLTKKQRVVFLLFAVDEMSGSEIATLLDIPLGTVRSRLRYARKAFRNEAATDG